MCTNGLGQRQLSRLDIMSTFIGSVSKNTVPCDTLQIAVILQLLCFPLWRFSQFLESCLISFQDKFVLFPNEQSQSLSGVASILGKDCSSRNAIHQPQFSYRSMLSCVDDFQFFFFVFCKAEYFPLKKTEAQNRNRLFCKGVAMVEAE